MTADANFNIRILNKNFFQPKKIDVHQVSLDFKITIFFSFIKKQTGTNR